MACSSARPDLISDLVAFVMLLLTITASLSVLAQTGASVVEAVGASVEIFAVIDREPAIPNDWSSKSDDDRATELRLARGDAAGCSFENVVHFAYASRPDLRVLDGLTLRIPAKSRAALVGPSGGGKTTLLHLLERFYDVGSGGILFDGIDVRAVEPTVLRTKMALVAQQPALFSGSIRDNIAYASRARAASPSTTLPLPLRPRRRTPTTSRRRSPTDLKRPWASAAFGLSGGQTQRVAIARALLAAPRLLLFDEATSALDAESRPSCRTPSTLSVLAASISVAHRLSTVVNADLIALVQGGRVIGSGTHELLLRGLRRVREPRPKAVARGGLVREPS